MLGAILSMATFSKVIDGVLMGRKQKCPKRGIFAYILAEAVRFELTKDSHPR
jgi:hypothetical protein